MNVHLCRPAGAVFSLLILSGFLATLPAQNPPSRVVGKTIWDGQLVEYVVVNGHMVVDGDVDIGPVEEADATPESKAFSPRSLVLPWVHPTLWPTGVVPYILDSDVPSQQRVTDAVAIWNTNTPVRCIPRTNESTYLHFRRNTVLGACFTTLARAGGEQFVDVLDSCDAAIVAH